MPQLLKPARLDPVPRNKRSHRHEKPVHCNKCSPCSPKLEKTHAQQQRPNAAGWKKIFHANRNQKKAGVAILISDKIDFEVKNVTRDKTKSNRINQFFQRLH